MTEYTPTTEEVRDVYKSRLIKVGDNRFELVDEIEADAEFDRWLAEVIREAKWVGWEEGWDARVNAETITPTENPYRQGEEQ